LSPSSPPSPLSPPSSSSEVAKSHL
jgi:hypothetical protein